MGLFSFLKSEKPVYKDWVWKSRPMAWRGMITETLKVITGSEIPIVFCFFEDTQIELESFLSASKVPFYRLSSNEMGEAAQQDKVVYVSNTNLISSPAIIDLIRKFNVRGKVSFFFAGHYPLPDTENSIVKKLKTTFPQSTITFCSSLDDPSFKLFNADRIIKLMESLGMKEEEVIEHPMVSSAMKRAREKVASQVSKETPTQSEAEWFALNGKEKYK